MAGAKSLNRQGGMRSSAKVEKWVDNPQQQEAKWHRVGGGQGVRRRCKRPESQEVGTS